MFCLNYYPFQKYLEDADELKIKYNPTDDSLKDFLQKYSDKSIVMDITESNIEDLDIKLFKGLYEEYKNIKLIIDYNDKQTLEKIQTNELPFFFINSVTTIDALVGLIKYHPTDMYICEELGFHLDKVSTILHDNNIKVRVYPNICQSSFPQTPSLKTFFIRPEDIDYYSAFVDVFELIIDKSRQRVMFKIYKQKKWIGKIQEIIPNFDNDLDSKYLLTNFGPIRSKCGKRCMYNPNSCHICERLMDLSKTLQKAGLMIRTK